MTEKDITNVIIVTSLLLDQALFKCITIFILEGNRLDIQGINVFVKVPRFHMTNIARNNN